jgi:Fe-S-cluster containining protein
LDFRLDRKSPFSFTCRVCGQCCSGKVIMVGPHEILGMSRILGISTTEFLAAHADNGGTTLRYGDDGRCVFVTPSGCQVHARRPLVCRLYPLGRTVDDTGDERFGVFTPETDCKAEIGEAGTVENFLGSQGVEAYVDWSRRYGALYKRMVGLFDRIGVEGRVDAPASGASATAEWAADQAPVASAPLSSWQDIDASLAGYCAAKGLAVPAAIEASIDLHLKAMKDWLDDLEGRVGTVPDKPKGAKEP